MCARDQSWPLLKTRLVSVSTYIQISSSCSTSNPDLNGRLAQLVRACKLPFNLSLQQLLTIV